jgi:hypothetical protein
MICRLLFISLLLPGLSRAQVKPSVPGPIRPWVLKFAPLSLIDLSSTVQFAAEGVVASNQSLQFEVGYGWQAMNIWLAPNQDRFSQYEVWRGRAEWRKYWRGRQAPYGAYTAIEGLYKRESAFAMATMAVNDNMGQLQYTLQSSLPISKDVFGISVKIGRQFSLTTNGRLVCDFYGGLGLRTQSIQRTNPPVGYHLSRQPFIDINPFVTYGWSSLFGLSGGFKIGYAL